MASTISGFGHLQIPLEDVVKATNNFDDDNIIGHGDFGPAYRGQLLWSGKLIKITARRLDRKNGPAGDVEFLTEISTLANLNHPNLVSLIGFCDEKDEKIIITSHEANGSLQEHLHYPDLTWTQRLRISVGVARALSYLYHDEGRSYGIIHRNINSSSILLDRNYEAKLSGFEISIKQPVNRRDHIHLSEPIGIKGYIDPATIQLRGVTTKSDVHSFGIVLFELLCGRESFIPNDENRFLKQLVKDHYGKKTLKNIIHPDLWNQITQYSFVRYSKIAYSCLEDEQAHRPDPVKIAKELERALEIHLRCENIVRLPFSFGKLVFNNSCSIIISTEFSAIIGPILKTVGLQ